MENQEYYEILAKKLDATIFALSDRDSQKISETWMEYLKILFPPKDVKYLVELNVHPDLMTAKKFAKKINKSIEEATDILERLFHHDVVMKVHSGSRFKYGINMPQTMISAPPLCLENKYPKDKAEKVAELSYKLIVEEKWSRNYEGTPETPMMRIIPVQESIKTEQKILSYEDVLEMIKTAKIVALQKCACRERLEFLGIRECNYPIETCIGLNHGAQYFIDRGLAREITKDEAKKLLKKFNQLGLVHITENYQDGDHGWICNCCSCCCVVLCGITQWDNPRAVGAANFVATIKNLENCEQCGTCVKNCKFQAVMMNETGPVIDQNKCMGCGICVVNCTSKTIDLKRINREYICKDQIELGLKVLKETDRNI
jgi:Pyruvate/2-oxoacid:ferredoxin oxidoreductase delta subunit